MWFFKTSSIVLLLLVSGLFNPCGRQNNAPPKYVHVVNNRNCYYVVFHDKEKLMLQMELMFANHVMGTLFWIVWAGPM